MTDRKVQINIRIPSKAQSNSSIPYLKHNKFREYCNANKVCVPKGSLEAYEKSGLFFPCIRMISPREFLIREFRTRRTKYRHDYKKKDDWKPLIKLVDLIVDCQGVGSEEFKDAIELGHPLDRAIQENNPFVFNPENEKFKPWKSYKVSVDNRNGKKLKESKAEHYYAPWKIFFIHDLNIQNTYKYNSAIRPITPQGITTKQLYTTKLKEFSIFFEKINSFSYKRHLLITNYVYNTKKRKIDTINTNRDIKRFARELVSPFSYEEWIRFLRKTLEMHENYRSEEKIILSEAIKAYIKITVIFLQLANRYTFERICRDTSGKFANKIDIGYEKGVEVYPWKLEEMFPDARFELEKDTRWYLQSMLNSFNDSLSESEQLPDSLADELFDELIKEPRGTALPAVMRINEAFIRRDMWRDDKLVSGLRELVVSIEWHGKIWFRCDGKMLYGILNMVFPSDFNALKRVAGSNCDAKSVSEYIDKLKKIQKNTALKTSKKCGQHLLITYLTRNFLSHNTHNDGLFGKKLEKHLFTIYSSMVYTLFVIYADYKKI